MKQLLKVTEDTCSVRKLTIDGIECDSYCWDRQPTARGGRVTLEVEFNSLPASFDFDKLYTAITTCQEYHLYSDGTWESHVCVVSSYNVVLTEVNSSFNGNIFTFQRVQ